MNPGKLRHLITIQARTKRQNEYGEVVEEWQTVAKAWAQIKPIKSSEYFAVFKEHTEVTHRIIIRYIDRLNFSMRILHKGRVFEVVGLRNFFERNEYLEIFAKERVDG